MLPSDVKEGPEGIRKFVMATINAAHLTDSSSYEDTIVDGDKVLIHCNLAGKIIEKFDILPSGKPMIITDFELFKIIDRKIVEISQQFNFGDWQ